MREPVPGRALMRDKVWWRGIQKHKLNYKRCRPVMTRYDGCGVCMKVCPVQRYGMPAVMDHYIETGQVLGKGSHLLEGYTVTGMGYFGPGELPRFDNEFFNIPHGMLEDILFEEFKKKLESGEIPEGAEGDAAMRDFRGRVTEFLKGPVDHLGQVSPEDLQSTEVFRA